MNYNDEELIALLKRLHDKLHQADEIEKGSIIVILPPSLSTDEAMVLWKKGLWTSITSHWYHEPCRLYLPTRWPCVLT